MLQYYVNNSQKEILWKERGEEDGYLGFTIRRIGKIFQHQRFLDHLNHDQNSP